MGRESTKGNGMDTKGQRGESQEFRNGNGMIPKKGKTGNPKNRKVRIPNRERWDSKKEKIGTPREKDSIPFLKENITVSREFPLKARPRYRNTGGTRVGNGRTGIDVKKEKEGKCSVQTIKRKRQRSPKHHALRCQSAIALRNRPRSLRLGRLHATGKSYEHICIPRNSIA